MKNLTHYFIFIILINFSSCNQNDNEIEENLFNGFYKIESITSNELVDLNGDLQKSYDLKTEINDYFNENEYDLEIRPNYTNDNEGKLISLYFPEPYLSFEYPSHPQGYVEYAKNSIGVKFEYENDRFLLSEIDNDIIVIDKIELIENGKIKSTISKDYYDFQIQNWVNLKIEIIYTRME